MRTFNTIFMKLCIIFATIFIWFTGSLHARMGVGIEQERLQNVQEAALRNEQQRQATRGGIDNRSIAEIEEQAGTDRFAQTEAYFQIPALKEEVADTFTGSAAVVEHMDIISRVMTKEAQLRDTHWAFYYSVSNAWVVPQDLFTMLDSELNPSAKKSKNFTYLRFFEGKSGVRVNDFLTVELKKHGLVDDNGDMRGILLSADLSLFGNTGNKKSTWRRFTKEKQQEAPNRQVYQEILSKFKINHKYIDEILDLANLIKSKEQTIYQIFIPKAEVDNIGYLAWDIGIPAHKDTMEWVQANIKNKDSKKSKAIIEDLKNKFKKQQEKNPLFKDLIESIDRGDYSLNSFLKIYCNKPWELPSSNYMKAQFIFTKDVLLNDKSGVKMYRYTPVERTNMNEYEKRLEGLAKKMAADSKAGAAAAAA